MRFTLVFAIAAALWGLAASRLPAQTSAHTDVSATESDIQDIVYLAAERPVFLRLRISVLGQGFRGLRSKYARRLFQSLDGDGDGRLNAEEMGQIPPADDLLPPRPIHEATREFNSKPVDGDSDEIVTFEELLDYVNASTGSPFVVTAAPPIHAGKVRLFEAVDENRDGALSPREIQAAGRAILRFDANDDEIVDRMELLLDRPALVIAGSGEPPPELLLRLLAVDRESDAAQDALFAKLLDRYDKPRNTAGSKKESAGDGRLDPAELGVSTSQIARWDTDGDGTLQGKEGRSFLLNPIPALEITIPLGSDRTVSVVPPASAERAGAALLKANSGKRGNLQLTIDGTEFDLTTGLAASDAAETRRLYDKRFEAADGDGNEYLDLGEIRRLDLPEIVFYTIDRNSDSMVRKDEFLEYVELQRLLFSSRVILSLSQEAQSLLDLIDEGADDHLGRRELFGAPARIRDWDLNGDGQIESWEIPANSRLIFQNGETTLFRGEQARSMFRATAARAASGPIWFQKMDRNQDGDLSPREFLGPLDTFKTLDKNADGLLSSAEAEQLE